MKKVLISTLFLAFLTITLVTAVSSSQLKAGSVENTNAEVEESCCCQYETYDYLKDGTKKFRDYCYTWTTPKRCKESFGDANSKVVFKPKEECKCVVRR